MVVSGMVINTNVPSINGQRNLYISSKALAKSLERLSSGLRINRAGDDAAGLAISENLRSQIRGMDQAVRNVNDGISLVQTAEGTIATYTEIVQRIRVLAVQAASDVMSDDNRASIQQEIDQQLLELSRIGKVVDFNNLKLFDGSFFNKRIQVGGDAGETLEISIGDLRTHVIGSVAQETGHMVDANALQDGDVVINGIDVPSSASGSATDKARSINSVYFDTKVYARVENAQVVAGGAIASTNTLSLPADTLLINGHVIPAEGTITLSNGDVSGSLRRAINEISDQTGVQASIEAGALVLTATDDKDFTYTFNGNAADLNLPGVAGAQQNAYGRIRLYSDAAFSVADGNGVADDLIGIGAAGYGKDPNSSIDQVDITTFEKAQESILKIDNAFRQINDVRAGLGAVTNRLEYTVQNLMISIENLSASESRIRDADFAAETANLTRAQILQQSGTSVLAQANMTPQGALTLLQ